MAKLAHFDALLFIYDFRITGSFAGKAGRRKTISHSNLFTNNSGDIELK